jgi:hypothetical protein
MKKISLTLMILILGFVYAYADEIYLKDGSIKNGKIITVTDLVVAYDPEGDIAYEVIKRSKVVKIVYDNGKEVVLDKKEFKKLNVDKTDNEYQEISTKKSNKKEMISERRYRNSFLNIGLVGAWGMYDGDICHKEDRLIDEYAGNENVGHSGGIFYGGFELDLMFPDILLGTKFGIKGRYLFASDDDEEDDYDDGPLFSYQTLQVGPVLNPIIFETRVLTFTIQFYGLYGRIYNGTFNAMTGLRGRGLVNMSKSQYHTTFDGYTCSFGIGPHVIFEGSFPANLGINLNYTFAKFKFDKRLPVYNSDHTSYHAVSIEFAAGITF